MTAQLGLAFDAPPHLKPSAEKVYAMLRAAGPDGVTTGDFIRNYCFRFSARFLEIRKAYGVSITGERISDGQWRYWIEGV